MSKLIASISMIGMFCAMLANAQPQKYYILTATYSVVVVDTGKVRSMEFQDFQQKIMGNVRIIDNREQELQDEMLTEEYNNHCEPIERE